MYPSYTKAADQVFLSVQHLLANAKVEKGFVVRSPKKAKKDIKLTQNCNNTGNFMMFEEPEGWDSPTLIENDLFKSIIPQKWRSKPNLILESICRV